MNNISKKVILDKILLINFDEKGQVFKAEKMTNFKYNVLPVIKELDLYLIIVTSQNSLSRTDNHFQHFFGEKLLQENNWKRLSKIDATKPIHSSSISSTFSKMFKNPDPYNVRTRIYYRTDKVCVNFKDEKLSKKSCFTNQKNPFNEYNSEFNSTDKEGQCQYYMQDIMIDNYYMKRYSHEKEIYSKTGDGIITIGLIFKIKKNNNSYNNYKLIISNRCRHDIKNNNLNPIQIKKIKRGDKSSIYIVSSSDIVYNTGINEASNNDFEINTINLNSDCKVNINSSYSVLNTIRIHDNNSVKMIKEKIIKKNTFEEI